MRLRWQYSIIAKLIGLILPCFFVSCQSTEEDKDELPSPPLMTSTEYVYIPLKDIQISYFDKRKWRIITQHVEYIDNTVMDSVSSIWFYQSFPLEIIVLDNPDIHQSFTNNFNEMSKLTLRRTKVYLPFVELIQSDDLDSLLPACLGNEFRAIARVVSSQKYIGIPTEEIKLTEDESFRKWYNLGEVICINLIREVNENK
ncbi:hypothetical protein QEJ31_15400 [Pigmentibacter sp. JX0631]|uniref:hypothetical protein n=1 Tax=Pigmentibacter sp. JX0631 TaxID=2976982 RepID=UPI002469B1D8|nr:hypothetical protein [Pigmentibacter sp. JX0631]WGL59917.1 hypothetical protein QEJ31_15400 [Pigmentibacter sp. JX0631]